MKKPIILAVKDEHFGAELATLVRRHDYEPLAATNETAMIQAMVQAPVLCLVDVEIEDTDFNWERLIRFVKGPGKKNNHVPVIGFGVDPDAAVTERALQAGAALVVDRAAITTDLAALIEAHSWRIDPALCQRSLPPLALQGIEEFNQGLYFECHETLEDAWNEEEGILRILYQGILQIAVGYLHINRKNWRGAVKVLERGIPKAAHFRPVCQGVDVADAVAQAQVVRAKLIELGPERIDQFDRTTFPKIKVNGQFPGVESG